VFSSRELVSASLENTLVLAAAKRPPGAHDRLRLQALGARKIEKERVVTRAMIKHSEVKARGRREIAHISGRHAGERKKTLKAVYILREKRKSPQREVACGLRVRKSLPFCASG